MVPSSLQRPSTVLQHRFQPPRADANRLARSAESSRTVLHGAVMHVSRCLDSKTTIRASGLRNPCSRVLNAAQAKARLVIKRGAKLKVKLSLGPCLLQNKISPNHPLLPRTPRVSFPSRLVSFSLLHVCLNFHRPHRPLTASHCRKSLHYKFPLDRVGDDKVQDRLRVLAWWWESFQRVYRNDFGIRRSVNLAETAVDPPARVLRAHEWVCHPLWTRLHPRVSGANPHLGPR